MNETNFCKIVYLSTALPRNEVTLSFEALLRTHIDKEFCSLADSNKIATVPTMHIAQYMVDYFSLCRQHLAGD